MLAGAIEIGRRLKEAKSLVKHGEWGKWLEESVSYSQKAAGGLMKLYEEYGDSFPDGADSSNWTPVSNLTSIAAFQYPIGYSVDDNSSRSGTSTFCFFRIIMKQL